MARDGRLAIRILPLLLPLLAARPARALTWNVAPGGDDANPGTAAQPFKTLQRAADLVAADDLVIIESGTYTGFSLCYDHPQDGIEDAPITFLAKPGVVIDAPNAKTPDGIDLEGCSYIILDGFEVAGMPRAGIRSVSGMTNAVGVTIRNNDCHDNGTWGIFTSHVDSLLIENNRATNSQTQHGIYVSNACVSPVVRGNVMSGNAGAGLHMNGDASQGGSGVITGALVEKNVIHDNGVMGGSGINCDGVQASRIRNNLIYAEHASGISLYQGDAAKAATNNVVVNNTVLVASDGRWAINIQNASTGNTVLDNILLDANPMHGSMDVSADSLMGFTSDYNVVVDTFTTDDVPISLADWRATTKQDADSLIATAAQLFVSVTGNDYHLLPTAPAVGAGTTTDAPADDLEGTPRLGQDDVGAYQQCCKPDGGVDGASDAADAAGVRDGSRDAARDASPPDADGATGDAGAPTDAASADVARGAKPAGSSSGCGCATTPGGAARAWPTLLLAAGAVLLARRRR